MCVFLTNVVNHTQCAFPALPLAIMQWIQLGLGLVQIIELCTTRGWLSGLDAHSSKFSIIQYTVLHSIVVYKYLYLRERDDVSVVTGSLPNCLLRTGIVVVVLVGALGEGVRE